MPAATRPLQLTDPPHICAATRTGAILMAILALAVASGPARAQHAGDNPVQAADDAFGLVLGLESVGLYGPGGVRNFDPGAAGDVRVAGLYFDQQASLSNRAVEGSTVRIGVSEIGYAFPAPTGIVDYDLRHAGDGKLTTTVVASAGPFEAAGLSVDANVPVIGRELQVPVGASYQRIAGTGFGPEPGYISTLVNFAAVPQWSPNDAVTVRALFDWGQLTGARPLPVIFTAGDFLPPHIRRDYLGQDWAEGRSRSINLGGLMTARLSGAWILAAGVFHSMFERPLNFADLYVNTQPSGLADHVVVASASQQVASNSGEVRLTGHFASGEWRHELVFLARGRDTLAWYGGSAAVDAGPAYIDGGVQVPKPAFTFGPRTRDRGKLWSAGAAYRAQWDARADFAVGVQHESYEKQVFTPGFGAARLSDSPLRVYGTGALAVSRRLTAYAGYTQGLEDSGSAPGSAANRGEVLPAARTWQVDSGLRYTLTQKLKLIVGAFQIQKPYFNFDGNNVDRELGVQRSKGYELSLSGELAPRLDLTAGLLAGRVEINGPNLQTQGIGPIAYGQPRLTFIVNADYRLQRWPALSVDLTAFHFGAAPSSVDNRVYSEAVRQFNLGARYRFTLLGKPATLRAQLQNLTNQYAWNINYSPGYVQLTPRSGFAYLTADF